MVNEQYDKAIIKFVIPIAHFDPYPMINQIKQKCMSENIKSDIVLMISHEFFTNEEILFFLKSNTMNLFLYDEMIGRGISSTIDYAISVKRPFCISNSYMFRNIYSDQICVYKNSIQYCMNYSIDFINHFLKEYSNENMINKFKKIIEV